MDFASEKSATLDGPAREKEADFKMLCAVSGDDSEDMVLGLWRVADAGRVLNFEVCSGSAKMMLFRKARLLPTLCSKRFYSTPIGKIQPRLQLTITCTAPACDARHRSTHEFSRQAYEKGIVLVQCPACHTRHCSFSSRSMTFSF
jgi:hypothetical protein